MKHAKTLTFLGLSAFAALTSATALFACNGVLGITEAHVDPTLAVDGATPNPGDDASNDAGADAVVDPYTCDAYCTAIMETCTGVNQEYTTRDVCLAMCSHFELGAAGSDETNDSLACRVYHTASAKKDPDYHCRHGGPTGGGHCGEQPCNAFCSLTFALCNPKGLFPFDGGEPECRTACKSFPYLTTDAGDLTLEESSNTLNCRIYHLESAYAVGNPIAPSEHCKHTGVISSTCN
jgi:hypothetical protein